MHGESRDTGPTPETLSFDIEAAERDTARLNALGMALLKAIESGQLSANDEKVGRLASAIKPLAETQLKLVVAQLSAIKTVLENATRT